MALIASTLSNLVVSQLVFRAEVLDEIGEIAREQARDQDETAAPEERDRDTRTTPSVRARRELQANIFCPSCSPAPAGVEAAPGLALAPTQLPLTLLATMESDDPHASMVTIFDGQRRATGIFSVGDRVAADAVIAEIRRGMVVLRTREGLQILSLPTPEQARVSKQAKPKVDKPRKKNSREIPGAREAIECRGNACTVDRAFVEKLLADPRQLMRQAKLVPAVEDGEVRGFKIYRVRKGTLPRLLGLRSGDVLLAVNGTELDSMDRAMGLYNKLRRASDLSLTVKRKGQLIDKQISIR